MTTNTSLEERLAAVEAAIAELQKQAAIPQPRNWLEQITTSVRRVVFRMKNHRLKVKGKRLKGEK